MVDKTPDTGLSEPSQTLHKVEPLANGVVWVVVNALLGCSLAEHVGQKGGVSAFLVGHELNERHVLRIETGRDKIGLGEAGQAVVEKVELDPFLSRYVSRITENEERVSPYLVQAQCDRLVIEVAFHHVAWERTVGA